MDLSLERDSSALGSLFQLIINDMKNTSPLWEDFVAKASKLHACLRAAIQAIAAYLDAFQKIADAATNSRGASKEIGTALTRVCLRHKAVETRLKTFTTAIMDYLVQPLQEKLEDWKRTAATIDKEHAKEYKRCRTELKKRSTDTLRLQKKARKGQTDTLQTLMDSHMQDVTLRRAELEEVEKKSLRSVMIEERMRYCTFVHMLQPVVKEECEVMSELGHLQEAMQSIANVTKDPNVLPQASEELILDAKATMTLYPESPVGGSGGCSNSLGSRKSSVCSISSMNSSGSSSSPGHQYQRSLSQLISPAIRLKPGESSDSGFCSSPALTTQASTATSQSHAVSTWPPHSQDVDTMPPAVDRPHTISTTYEKGHQRPPLTVYTFQNPETILESGPNSGNGAGGNSGQNTPSTQKPPANNLSRPPLPVRCSSLERPLVANNNRNGSNLAARQCPSPIPAHITKELSLHHAQQQQQLLQQQQLQQQNPPTYVNMSELANMAALKSTNQQQQQQQQPQPLLQQQHSIDSISSQLSNESSTSNTQPQHHQTHQKQHTHNTRSHSTSSSVSSNTPSLRSHPSIESTVATPLVGQTPTPSSGSSTPQNPYSPLLTNSPSSTAVGTPSGGSITSNTTGQGFVYNVCSPTPPPSATLSTASDALKITELDGVHNPITPTNDTDAPPTDAESILTYQTHSNDTDSPTIVENDERSRASVLQKASMFEKQAAAAAQPAPVTTRAVTPADSGIYGTSRAPDHYRASPVQQPQYEQQEVDKSFEDSIQELNNLIGELDSFQREIDAGKQSSNTNSKTVAHFAGEGGNETIISDNPCQTRSGMLSQPSQPYCPSNQTNSSGCGTDISDTTSDEIAADTRSLTSLNFNNNCSSIKQNCNYNSDSELSRCYVSETSSLTGGYENPTFAHFASTTVTAIAASVADDAVSDSRSLLNADSISQAGDTLSMTHRHAYIDNGSDCGSGVVVIYDHQIPITPDMDYVKQNSEIVVLRTKDPQQLPMSEMRELQQLPANLCDTPESPTTPSVPQTATVAPAKQRLSSFRASSEQQLQLLGGHSNSGSMSNIHRQQQQQHEKGTQDGRNSLKGLTKVEMAAVPATATSAPTAGSDTIIRRKLPPKPNLSIFNGSGSPNLEVNTNSSRVLPAQNQQQHEPQQQHPIPTTPTPPQPPPLVPAMKLDFRADLDSKIRKQKQKLLQQERQQQAQQQHSSQQRMPQPPLPSQSPSTNANNTHINNNCNNSLSIKHASATSSPSIVNASNISKTNNIASNPASANSLPYNHHIYTNGSLAKLPQNQNHSHRNAYHTNSPQTYSPLASSTVKPTSSPSVSPAVPSNYSSSASASTHVSAATVSGSSSVCNSKPSITPRPASLSGGSTRIARRSSVNAAKPPPPVRRSSSVTPSHNVASGPQKHQPTTANSNLLHQQQNLMNNSTESLPPPPAYLLDTRQTHSTPTSPPSVMPHSAQKVAETVKALSAMRHQPASPHALRHLQQNQQQHQHQQQPVLQIQTEATLYSASIITNSCDEPDYMGYHNPYVELEAYASLPACHSKTAANYMPLHTGLPPPPIDYAPYNALPSPPATSAAPTYDHYALTPHAINQQPSIHNQQLQLKRQHNPTKEQHQIHQPPRPQQPYQQMQQLQPQANNCDAIYGNKASFRTSSPGIYAQPKISNNMSSFRTSSPGPNGHHIHQPQAHHPHQMPPAQPKTNPNLIAQLNARLSKQQPQTENLYGSTSNSPQHHYHNQTQQHEEPIYYGAHQQPLPPQTQPPPQQQHYDGKSHTEKHSKIYGSFSTSSSSTTSTTNFNNSPHFPLSSSTSSLLSKVTTFAASANSTNACASAISSSSSHYHTNQQHMQNLGQAISNSSSSSSAQYYAHKNVAAAQQTAGRQQSSASQQQQQNYREYYTCPPPLETPPPPPIAHHHQHHHHQHVASAANNNASATMPKSLSSRSVGGGQHLAAYAATATMPKNLLHQQQQRLQHQQQHQQQQQQYQQPQQQQYHHPTAITASAANQAQQHQQQPQQHLNQRPPMPLPHQQHVAKQKTSTNAPATLAGQQHKQPTVPSRHSSVQQKIFVATNPFIQTTAIHCHAPASVHSTPASPTCGSPAQLASIYGTSGRMAYRDHNSGGSNGGNCFYGNNASMGQNSNYASTNIEKTGSIRSKTKAEFLENLNAKLAKQGMSGRAFAVRNLINSKALPDPRICHESLMDQIKRGATLKRNQKINDRSAPKIL